MNPSRASSAVAFIAISACAPPTIYRSSGLEARGERAIESDIELASELKFRDGWSLGVLYSKERQGDRVAQNLLFALKPTVSASTVASYDLRHTASISLEQGRRLLLAIDKFIGIDTASLGPAKMFNFELNAGPIDEYVGSPDHHPFRQVTFFVVCSVTASGKYFVLRVPSPDREGLFHTIEFDGDNIQSLRQAIDSAIKKSE
jgi:hypothetical protein